MNPEPNYNSIPQIPGQTNPETTLPFDPAEINNTLNSNIVSGPNGSVMSGGALYSPNYSQGIAGWIIKANGDVEFNNGVFRGNITASTIDIGGSDSTSFHVDAGGNMWLGAATFATGLFKVSNGGQMNVNGAAGTVRQIGGTTGAVQRWQISLGDSTAEGGTDAGSNFRIFNYSDAGTLLNGPILIERKTGNVVVSDFGTVLPHASSILEIQSITKGVRFPNMTTTQRNLITPGAGTVIYNTTTGKLNVYTTAWEAITSV